MIRRPLATMIVVASAAMTTAACSNDDASGPASTTGTTTSSGSADTATTVVPASTFPASTGGTAQDLSRIEVKLRRVATLSSPTAVVARSGTDTMYAAERDGLVRALHPRQGPTFTVDKEAVLDITDLVGSTGGERGLLGLCFSPDGSVLVVSYTDGNDDGASVIARYDMSGDKVDVASRIEVLRLAQPFPNHNGGHITFGPEGYLYAGFGDGGGQGDPSGNGQDPSTLLGSLIRIDVLNPDVSREHPYEIPDGNPFMGSDAGRPEVWLFGVRNPWRFSFDAATAALWVGDVGGSEREELDWFAATSNEPAGRGANLGWALREGTLDTERPGTRPADLVEPVYEYDHDEGSCIVAGLVYRGSLIPGLVGAFLYSDSAQSTLRAIPTVDGVPEPRGATTLTTTGSAMEQVVSFGHDNNGELYVVSLSGAILTLS